MKVPSALIIKTLNLRDAKAKALHHPLLFQKKKMDEDGHGRALSLRIVCVREQSREDISPVCNSRTVALRASRLEKRD